MVQRKVSRTVVIDAPARRVFGFLADPRQHQDFDGSTTVRGTVDGPQRLHHGAVFRMRMRLWGFPYRTTNRVVEYQENRRIAWQHSGPHRWRWTLRERPDATTHVTATFDYAHGGPLWYLFYILFGSPARNAAGIEASLPRLKALSEIRARRVRTPSHRHTAS
ncbi:SRPBCC family protein [Spiractinospora alimapuensis]|uniref:SRPBCC family protein n=1 Tax=Spiractinospora alimapuensis TaxID=2820884 RepID=UPI001F2F5ECD|nr:SRPBCC family protein [Spiractinospora alimapuensis]QVQ54433.1 SRPBCC family protein [Spiractinospora alimapuensis]